MSSKAQLHCRIDPGLKDWLDTFAQAQGRQVSEVMEAKLREWKDQDQSDPALLEEKRIEHQLSETQRTLDELEDTSNKKHVHNREIGYALLHAYPELKADWRSIRTQALKDFNEGEASPIKELMINSPLEIIEACRFAIVLYELRASRVDLATRLATLFGVKIEIKEPIQPVPVSAQPIEEESGPTETGGPSFGPEQHAQPQEPSKVSRNAEENDEDDSWNDDDWDKSDDHNEEWTDDD